MRQEPTQVGIFIDLGTWYDDVNIAYVTSAGVIILARRIPIVYFKRVVITSLDTHLYRTPTLEDRRISTMIRGNPDLIPERVG